MKVECEISPDCGEPRAVLHINKMTPAVAEAIALLEREGEDSPALTASREGKTFFLEPDNLELARAEGREIVCYDRLKKRYLLNRPLYELEGALGAQFVRISKSAIVNIRRISHVEAGLNGVMRLVMKNGVEDYISRSFRKAFRERLGLK